MATAHKAAIPKKEERQERDANNPVISVDNNGMVHALREGNAVLIGEYAGVKDEVRVTVESR